MMKVKSLTVHQLVNNRAQRSHNVTVCQHCPGTYEAMVEFSQISRVDFDDPSRRCVAGMRCIASPRLLDVCLSTALSQGLGCKHRRHRGWGEPRSRALRGAAGAELVTNL